MSPSPFLRAFATLCATALLSQCSFQLNADTIAFSPTGLSLISNEPVGNDGLFFIPNTDVSITSLGYVDCGFSVGHEVGLFDVTTATLLASTTITGSSALVDDFRYNTITPVILTAGHEYTVVGNYSPGTGPDSGFEAVTAGAASQITYEGYKYDSSSTLDLPSLSYTSPIFGPNFQFVPVPEPAEIAVLLAGFAVWTVSLNRKAGQKI